MRAQDASNDVFDRGAMARILHRSFQEAFELEKDIPDIASERESIDIVKTRLIHSMLSSIKEQLKKLPDLSILSEVPLTDTLRLRKICEASLNIAQNIQFKLAPLPRDEQHETEMARQVMIYDCGILSAYICLLIRSGGRHILQLCSGSGLQNISNTLKHIIETCIVPALLSSNRLQNCATTASFAALISTCEEILEILTSLVADIQFPEAVLYTLEALALLTLHKDSGMMKATLGKLRTVGLDLIAQIFHHYPTQRLSTLIEILTSLKETSASHKVRTFKLHQGASIQAISALLVRIVQSSASLSDNIIFNAKVVPSAKGSQTDTGRLAAPITRVAKPSRRRIAKAKAAPGTILLEIISPRLLTAENTATQIVDFIVGRALAPTKIRDESFRNLLYMFVEDFIICLGDPDFPAAELLLRLFLARMILVVESDRTTPAVKLMAVDLLGMMGGAIAGLSANTRHTATSETMNPKPNWYPTAIVEDSLQLKPRLRDITALGGLFHVTVESLASRLSVDLRVHGALQYVTTQWVFHSYSSAGIDTEHKGSDENESLLAAALHNMAIAQSYASSAFDDHYITTNCARVAYNLILLRSQFCESFNQLLETLLVSAKSRHASIRCRCLKVLLQILEADPYMISHAHAIRKLASERTKDILVSVRESSLRLINRCIELKPGFAVEMMPDILRRVTDSSNTVRKHSVRILKAIYLQTTDLNVRSGIAEALLYRTADLDLTIREIACQSIYDIWMSPYLLLGPKQCPSQLRLFTVCHVCCLARVIQRDRRLPPIFTAALQAISLHPIIGPAAHGAYSSFVATLFDMLNGPTGIGTTLDTPTTFQLLLTFAKTNNNIFTEPQLQLLQPYIGKIPNGDDMTSYRSVVSILYHAIPQVSNADPVLLRSIRTDLTKHISRLSRPILGEVIPCLWAISEILHDHRPLTAMIISCLENMKSLMGTTSDPANHEPVRKVKKLLLIAGICGRYCNFEAQLDRFLLQQNHWECQSVSGLMINTFSPFFLPEQPIGLRETALDAICMVCQRYPTHFTSPAVITIFEEAFEEKNPVLELVVLRAFKRFLVDEEQQSHDDNETSAAKLDHIGGGHGDGVAAYITQKFMTNRKDIVRIALATQGDEAFLAVEVLASMIRQGFLHPKECIQICIALETSQNKKIAEASYAIHQTLQSKFETIIEKEYVRAVDVTYEYQRDVVQNLRGATCDPYRAVLHRMMEVTKTGKKHGRKKFFESLCARMELDLRQRSCLDLQEYLQRSQFILDNIAFFEYVSVEELATTITAMNKVFTRAGMMVVNAIEKENLDQTTPINEDEKNDSNCLQRLAAFSTTLISLWVAKKYLCRRYGLASSADAKVKDSSRAPTSDISVDGGEFWETSSMMTAALHSKDIMLTRCRALVDLFYDSTNCNLVTDTDDLYLDITSKLGRKAGGSKLTGLKGGKRKAPETRLVQKKKKTLRKRPSGIHH